MSARTRPRSSMRLAACGLVLAGLVSVFFISRASAAPQAQAQVPSGPAAREAQVFSEESTGVSSPVGLAFSSASSAFHVVGAQPAGLSETEVVKLTPFDLASPDRAGSARLAAAAEDPINTAFDARGNRLLLLGQAGELFEVQAGGGGDLDSATLTRRDIARFALGDPQGMAVDPASGTIFVLDAALPRIVRIEPDPAGGFEAATTSEIDLRAAGLSGVRGLAFDPSSGHLYLAGGRTLIELTTSGAAVSARDLSELALTKTEGMVFAPSGDKTDAASELSLYLADSGDAPTGSSGDPSASPVAAPSAGHIMELSLAPLVVTPQANFSSQLVTTVDMGALSPPSTDPSGITYVPATNRLLISDGEVEETVNGITHFQGANIWELNRTGLTLNRTANVSNVPPGVVVPVTNEPTGTALNPTNGHYYISADSGEQIYDVNPGADGLLGTAGDTVSSFDTLVHGNTDPEGITYDTFSGHLFVADGLNREIYRYTSSGGLIGHFDTAQYGVEDPETVEFNPDSGTLFILSDRSNTAPPAPIIVETTTGGSLIQTIDASASGAQKPAGLAYAPASNGTATKRFYIVDRGIDNNSDPNAVDGKLYEMTTPAAGAPSNTPPSVNAGTDQAATLPANANLDGTVSDDGNPAPPQVATTWSQVSGPSTVTFGNANAVDTTASVPVGGIYVVRLTASDGQFSAFDDVTLTFSGSGSVQSVDVPVSFGVDDAEESTANVVLLGNTDLDLMTADEANLVVGTRFRGVAIPAGATISSAYLQFTAEEAPNSQPTTLTIRGQAADSPGVFTTNNGDLSSRPTTTASAAWTVDPWLNVGDAVLAQRSPNLAGIVQEIVNRPGWTSGNALVLLVRGSGTRIAESFNKTGTVGGDPLLHVEYGAGPSGDAPQITSYGGGASAAVTAAENQTSAADVDAVDPNPGDTLTYSISGGADQSRFSIVPSTGVVSFVSAPNFESPTDAGGNNVYDVTVSVSDGNGGSDSQAIAATVLNVNEFSPVIDSDGGGPTANISRPENQTAVTDVNATDSDLETLTYSIIGGPDAAAFAIVPATGVLSFVAAPDFENPTDVGGDHVYDVVVEVSDGSRSDTQDLAVTITDVAEGSNQAPSVSAGSDQTITLPAGATLDGTVTDDGLPNPPGAVTTTWTKESGPGNVTFGNASAADTTATFSQTGAYVLRLTASDSLLSAFDELTVTVNAGVSSLDIRVSVGADDAEERTDNTVALGSGDLDMMSADELNAVVGTRFRNITIPPGASITSAYVQFQSAAAHSAATTLTIRGHAADNASVFTTVNLNLSTRPTTTASAAWTVDPWLTIDAAGSAQRSPSLTTIVQEIVNRPGWASGNSLVLLVTGSGTRVARSFNSLSGAAAPLLHVEWTTGGGGNLPPSVGAGPDQTITVPAGATLDGTVTDDGLPAPPTLTTTWSKQSGPGTVTFGNASAVDTTATFSQSGTYVLRLTASDTALSAFDELTVNVNPSGGNQPPSVGAGPDQTITLPAGATLDGTVTDDGLPAPPTLTTTWSQTSGPGTASFGNASAVDTTATFSQSGTYVLRLTASDTALSAFDELTVIVNPPPSGSPLYFSLFDVATVGGVTAENEDVVYFNGTTFSLAFDGSDVGITTLRIDAFSFLDATRLLLSFDAPGTVPGIAGTTDDSDVVLFTSTSLGPTTAGTFSMYIDGSDIGLTTNAEDVDAVELLSNGHVLISASGSVAVTGVSGDDKDLLDFTPTQLGPVTTGTFAMYFDGSDVGLTTSGEDIDAAAVDATGKIYLSTVSGFAVTGVSGGDEDVFVFTPTTLGSVTSGTYSSTLYFDGSVHGLTANDLFAIELP